MNIREIQITDIDLIADYWLLSNDDFLVGMGVDLKKRPPREDFAAMLKEQMSLPDSKKKALALIAMENGKPIGHCNVNGIQFGKVATIHLHLWSIEHRKKGLGTEMVKKSIPIFFHRLQLEKLICEPYALNPAPNKTLTKLGFKFIKKYTTIPGSINCQQEVNQYCFYKKQLSALK